MPLPNPTTLWKYAKYVIRGAEFALPAAYGYLESQLSGGEDAEPLRWVRANIRFNRATPAGTSEDLGQFKLDLVNITGGALDTSWTSADLNTISTDIQAGIDALLPYVSSSHTFKEIRYYPMAFNPSDPGPGQRGPGAEAFLPSGPPIRIDTFTKAATGNQFTPYQVAATCTLKTGWPQHWGRMYLPGPVNVSVSAFDTNGRLTSGYRAGALAAVKGMYDALAGHDFLTMVPVTQVGKQPFHALLTVQSLVVDDIPDVQRKRRGRQVAARNTASS